MFGPILEGEVMSLPILEKDIDSFRKFLSINCPQAWQMTFQAMFPQNMAYFDVLGSLHTYFVFYLCSILLRAIGSSCRPC